MVVAAFILGLIGTVTGCLALLIEWLTYRRDCAKLRLEASREQQASEPFFKWLGGIPETRRAPSDGYALSPFPRKRRSPAHLPTDGNSYSRGKPRLEK